MRAKIKATRAVDKPEREIVRASISFPIEDYEKLEQTAVNKRVSLAWVVREAVREYLAENHTTSDKE